MADMTFNYKFIIKMCFKLIAIGIFMDESSYLRHTWNQLDFFVVSSNKTIHIKEVDEISMQNF